MAFDVEQIRATAQRVAASHGLDVVEIEFPGGAKHRILRVFIEKNAEERRRLAGQAVEAGADRLAGVTHGDCEAFSRDFGTVLDVEDLVPGAEYTLEVSSPGLDRKLHSLDDYRRFSGMLAKVQTFTPVAGNRHWQGRLTEVSEQAIRLDVSASRQRKSSERRAQGAASAAQHIEVALNNIEKAQLVPEF
ncbi:MAG TPA: ribosome maturation factor RimP [Acidobacteriaceae bacterium]|jgi:ribosome maturation factor RimP|nr:ribosome maturation factor RimP [Acidobacteriaceae bacterium]